MSAGNSPDVPKSGYAGGPPNAAQSEGANRPTSEVSRLSPPPRASEGHLRPPSSRHNSSRLFGMNSWSKNDLTNEPGAEPRTSEVNINMNPVPGIGGSRRRFVIKTWSHSIMQRTGSILSGLRTQTSKREETAKAHVRFRDPEPNTSGLDGRNSALEGNNTGHNSGVEDFRTSTKSVTSQLRMPRLIKPTMDPKEAAAEEEKRRKEKALLSREERLRKREEQAMMFDVREVKMKSMRPDQARQIQSAANLPGLPAPQATTVEEIAEGEELAAFDEDYEISFREKLVFFLFRPNYQGIFNPKAAVPRVWSFLRVLATAAITFVALFECAFTQKGFEDLNVLRIIEIVVEIFFVLDIFMQLNMGYIKDSAVIADRGLVISRYIREKFIFDGGAAFPVFTEIGFGKPWVRLLHVLKVITVQEDFIYFVRASGDRVGAARTLITVLIMWYMAAVHVVASLWFIAMGRQDCPDGSGLHGLACSWISQQDDIRLELSSWIDGRTSLQQNMKLYMACLYWASGAGNTYEATTSLERVIATSAHVGLSLVFGAFIIANVLTVLTEFKSDWTRNLEYHKKVDDINGYMHRAAFPRDLQHEVRRYYQDSWLRKQVDISDRVLLSELPRHIKERVLLHLARQLLETSDFFLDLDIGKDDDDKRDDGGHSGAASRRNSSAHALARSRNTSEERGKAMPSPPTGPYGLTRKMTIASVTRRILNTHTYSKDAMTKIALAANKLDRVSLVPGEGEKGVTSRHASRTSFSHKRKRIKLDPPVSNEEKMLWTEALARKMYPVSFSPGEVIFSEGETRGDLAMYIVKSGNVALSVGDKLITSLSSGTYFGQLAEALAYQRKRIATAKAMIFTEAFCLDEKDMRLIWEQYPRLKTLNLAAVYARNAELGLPPPQFSFTERKSETERSPKRTALVSMGSDEWSTPKDETPQQSRRAMNPAGPLSGGASTRSPGEKSSNGTVPLHPRVREVWRKRVLAAQQIARGAHSQKSVESDDSGDSEEAPRKRQSAVAEGDEENGSADNAEIRAAGWPPEPANGSDHAGRGDDDEGGDDDHSYFGKDSRQRMQQYLNPRSPSDSDSAGPSGSTDYNFELAFASSSRSLATLQTARSKSRSPRTGLSRLGTRDLNDIRFILDDDASLADVEEEPELEGRGGSKSAKSTPMARRSVHLSYERDPALRVPSGSGSTPQRSSRSKTGALGVARATSSGIMARDLQSLREHDTLLATDEESDSDSDSIAM